MSLRSCLPAYLGSQGAPALPHILDVPVPPGLALTYRGMVVAYVEAESPASAGTAASSNLHEKRTCPWWALEDILST